MEKFKKISNSEIEVQTSEKRVLNIDDIALELKNAQAHLDAFDNDYTVRRQELVDNMSSLQGTITKAKSLGVEETPIPEVEMIGNVIAEVEEEMEQESVDEETEEEVTNDEVITEDVVEEK